MVATPNVTPPHPWAASRPQYTIDSDPRRSGGTGANTINGSSTSSSLSRKSGSNPLNGANSSATAGSLTQQSQQAQVQAQQEAAAANAYFGAFGVPSIHPQPDKKPAVLDSTSANSASTQTHSLSHHHHHHQPKSGMAPAAVSRRHLNKNGGPASGPPSSTPGPSPPPETTNAMAAGVATNSTADPSASRDPAASITGSLQVSTMPPLSQQLQRQQSASRDATGSSPIGSHGPPKKTRSKNFLPGERALLLGILDAVAESGRVPPRQGFDWDYVAREFNRRRQLGEGRSVIPASSAGPGAGSGTGTGAASKLSDPGANALENGPVVLRSAVSLRRFFNRLNHRTLKGGGLDTEEDVQQSFAHAAKLLAWEERNRKSGGFVSESQPQIPNGGSGSGPGTLSGQTEQQSQQQQNHLDDEDSPTSPRAIPQATPLRRRTSISHIAHMDHEADADAEDNDDDVQSKHSHVQRSITGASATTAAAAVSDLGFSNLFNDVYDPLDIPSLSQGYPMLDGMFTPHYHGTTSGREGTTSGGPYHRNSGIGNGGRSQVSSSSQHRRRRRPTTTSSTGYDSGSRRKLRRMTRGLSQDGTAEFLNFSAGMPSTPGPFMHLGGAGTGTGPAPTTGATTPGPGFGLTGPPPTDSGPPGGAAGAGPPTGATTPGGVGAAGVSAVSLRPEDMVVMKDRMILQLHSTIYSMFADLREATERIQRLSENEARLVSQEQRSITEMRMMEVSHREQIHNYEERIHDMHRENSKLRRRHARQLKKLAKLIPPNSLQQTSVTDTARAPNSPGHTNQQMDTSINTSTHKSTRLVSPPPLHISSPVLEVSGFTNSLNINTGTTNSGTSNLAPMSSSASAAAGVALGRLKKPTSIATTANSSHSQTKSVKLLSRDTIIKDTFFRDASGSSSDTHGRPSSVFPSSSALATSHFADSARAATYPDTNNAVFGFGGNDSDDDSESSSDDLNGDNIRRPDLNVTYSRNGGTPSVNYVPPVPAVGPALAEVSLPQTRKMVESSSSSSISDEGEADGSNVMYKQILKKRQEANKS